ncbi:hypothetical protein SANA_28140 [Gottschalkiaceae bacterium SANA]|nr:hypothetical protein SANA_28140 [Gottschalkiaceae bacterium SANA]
MNKERKLIGINLAIASALTLLVFWISLSLRGQALAPDQGASWYYWKLPSPTFWTRFTAWGGYLLHQFALWYVILNMHKDKQPPSKTLTKYNKQLIAINLSFILLHAIQSFIWYDGLAQDVSVASSQYSVILMLVLVLIMENGRRGLFFGKKVKLPKEGVKRVFDYHGFYIAWAITYTFWYHPMVGTVGHLFGFFYMFLLFAQLSFAGTKFHQNKIWTFLLEIIVLFHGTTVAILQGTGIWSMFFFGFATMFIVTQMYGLPISKTWRLTVTALYALAAVITYSGFLFDKSLTMIHQVIWIPTILYGLVFLIVYTLKIPSLFKTTS